MQDHSLEINNLDDKKEKIQFCCKELTELLKSENEIHNENLNENHNKITKLVDEIHLPQL